MNRFTERQQKIINEIAGTSDFITGKALSILLNVSIRTIQTEISRINQIIMLVDSSNRGYSINKSNYFKLNKSNISKPRYEHIMLRKLILADTPYHIEELAEMLYMSTSSLEKKLRSFSDLFKLFNLRFYRENMYVQIIGNELDKRHFIHHLILKEISPSFNSINNLDDYLPDTNIEKIETIVLNSIDKYNYFIENAYSSNLILHVAIALYRMKSNHYVEDIISDGINSKCIEYQIALEICKQYSQDLPISPSKIDISHIATLLSGQIKPLYSSVSKLNAENIMSKNFYSEINDILFEVFNYYMLNIDYSNQPYRFALHIDAMIKRVKNNFPAPNDLLKNIKENCPFIHDVSVQIARKISEAYNISIPVSEIGYIDIHIGYLIEDSIAQNNKLQVILLCSEYHNITESIQKRLLNNFSEFIHLTVINSKHPFDNLDNTADLIITTFPFKVNKKTICISPFYTTKDYLKIDNAIKKCLKEKQKSEYTQTLSSVFHENLFFRRNDLKTKYEIINFLGQKVIDFGLAEEGFIQSVIERENLSSTCFFDTFAIPHANEINAKKTMFCVLINEEGIQWDKHNIYIVLMMTVHQDDRKEFMTLYEGVIQSLANPEKVKRLVSAKTHLEFIHYLEY